jgi:hypothetical protein
MVILVSRQTIVRAFQSEKKAWIRATYGAHLKDSDIVDGKVGRYDLECNMESASDVSEVLGGCNRSGCIVGNCWADEMGTAHSSEGVP